MATLEQKIVKLLLDKETFDRLLPRLHEDVFPGDLRQVINCIRNIYDKYGVSAITIEDLKDNFFKEHVVTSARRRALVDLFEIVDEIDRPNEDMVADLVGDMVRKHRALKIGQFAADILNGGDASFKDIENVLAGAEDNVDIPYTATDVSLDTLLEASSPDKLFSFNISALQDMVGGAGRGHLIGLNARPDAGKSSFAAYLNLGFLEQGLSVCYMGNEEPAYKIAMNHVRACYGMTDKELIEGMKKGKIDVAKWKELSSRFHLYECVGMSADELDTLVSIDKPDVLIIDQIDKFSIANGGEGHERLKNLWAYTREIAKRRDLLCINICQASAEATGVSRVTYDMADGSRTGKGGEVDLWIGIGRHNAHDEDYIRPVNISKNKINGAKGMVDIAFIPEKNTWE